MDVKIGQPVLRKEDERLLTGKGRFSDDLNLPNQLYAAIVRSPHAHAVIEGYDTAAALAAPGIHAVLTGDDIVADGLKPIPHNPVPSSPPDLGFTNTDGSQIFRAPHYPLPVGRTRFVGEGVAMVVADSVAEAKAAAELVNIRYAPLPAVTDTTAAAASGAPKVYDDLDSNVCIDAEFGDRAAVDAAFATAAHVVRMDFDIARVTGVPMEPRAAIGEYDASTDRHTLYAGSGGVVRQKRELAAVLGVEGDKVRVVSRDVGGNYGTRNAFYPEFALVVWAAKRLGRPVKWTCERSESFVSDYQGRDLVTETELALDKDGRFLAIRGSNLSNVGAYTVSFVPLSKGVSITNGVYDIPLLYIRARATFSNTPPTNPYRSAGRPEVMYILERLIHTAARETGIDPIELRRRNVVAPTSMPYTNPLGITCDSGHFEENMDKALALADWDGYAARKADADRRGKLRGIGIAHYIEMSMGFTRERSDITVKSDGQVDVVIGTLSSGQGHETSFTQVAAEMLGVPFEQVRLIQGDTDIVQIGGGSHSGRSMRMAGTVIHNACNGIIDKGKRIAAHVLEAAEADIEFAGGIFTVAGTDRRIGLFDAAREAETNASLPEDLRGGLEDTSDVTFDKPAFPSGCHICEVEIDPETGFVALDRYTAIDDVGRVINPVIVDGQTHGGIVQGVGEAGYEKCVYGADDGQMLSGSLMDYCLPRADDMPSFRVDNNEVPSDTNPLGVKAGGEGGTTPALGVYVNAVVDALAPLGIRHVEMPLTPLRVWQAIQESRS